MRAFYFFYFEFCAHSIDDIDLTCLHWLDLQNLEMELFEFKENYIWNNKLCDLRERFEKIVCNLRKECEGMMKENEGMKE